jgi:hypothetical protein
MEATHLVIAHILIVWLCNQGPRCKANSSNLGINCFLFYNIPTVSAGLDESGGENLLSVKLVVSGSNLRLQSGEPINIGQTYYIPGFWYRVEDAGHGRLIAILAHHGGGHAVCRREVTWDGTYELAPYASKQLSGADIAYEVKMVVERCGMKQQAPIAAIIERHVRLRGRNYAYRSWGEYVSDGQWHTITRAAPPKGTQQYRTSDNATFIAFITRRENGTILELTFWLSPDCNLHHLTTMLESLL